MKSLNLAQPQVLMVVGNPGAGKSFFARQFSETFNIPAVSTDRIRYELFAEPTYSSDENDLVGRIAAYMVEELLKTKRSFIVDGGMNSKVERLRLNQPVKKAGYGSTIIWVQTDAATCRARALRRNPEKNTGDTYNRSLNGQTFEALAKRFTEPLRENHIVISGKHTYNTQAKMVLRKLIAVREAKAEAAHRQEMTNTRQSPPQPEQFRRGIIIR